MKDLTPDVCPRCNNKADETYCCHCIDCYKHLRLAEKMTAVQIMNIRYLTTNNKENNHG